MSNRPTGVTILAILALIGGLLNLSFGGFEILLGPMVGEEMANQGSDAATSAAVGGVMTAMGVGLLLVGVLQLIVAFGLFTLKGWAWMLAVILQILGIAVNALRLGGETMVPAGIAILISVGILYYLFRPHVKQAFGRS